MTCEEIYETGLLYHHYANTAYPLTPQSFMQYKLTDSQEIREFVTQEWQDVQELALYVHVPFCQSRCKFCEYVVLENPSVQDEDEYVNLLLQEMEMYAKLLQGKKIVGFDLGGGTPTRLSVENLQRITQAVRTLFQIQPDVVFSIETTPLIAANDFPKIQAVFDMGYRRISMGVQTVSEKLLAELGRDGSKGLYQCAVENIRKAGFRRFNIDLMYGFLHQGEADFDNTLHYTIGLGPEYITLYRNRYKGTKLEYEAGGVSIYKAMYQYRIAYRILTENGYQANVGKNTFSRVDQDYGTSDYLTRRVIEGTPYVGMGLGAQSFGPHYLAYNLGAAEKRMERYRAAIQNGQLPFQDIYHLPQDECIAKMVSVAFYFAFVDLDAFQQRFGVDFLEKFADEVQFVLKQGLMEQRGRRLYLTERGADYINGVIPLFYSERSKQELKTAFSSRCQSKMTDEELFLSAYNIKDYDRPSVAVDIAALTIRTQEEKTYRHVSDNRLAILLIKRGEHPYMNAWALPGGFLRMDETIEACARREIQEETGISPTALMPVGVFSAVDRDPRGRIISNAFVSILGENSIEAVSGDDAIDAKWFDVSFTCREDGVYTLTLTHDKTVLTAELKELSSRFGSTQFQCTQKGAFAFDHAEIIAAALSALRSSIQNPDLIFDFLPEKFTLTALQKVQESITDITVLPANFRRKMTQYVVETGEYETGGGHRPAKLFMRRQQ